MVTGKSSRNGAFRLLGMALAWIAVVLLLCTSVNAQDESAYSKGVNLYSSKKYAEALAVFDTGKIDGSQAANAAYYRALCYHQMGKLKEAAAAYRYVFSKYPDSAAARNSILVLAKLNPQSAAEALKNVDIFKASPVDWSNLSEQVAVPFKRAMGGAMIVTVELGGVPVSMLFDTGASSTTCTESFLKEHNIPVKRTQQHGRSMGVGGEVSTTLCMVDLKLGQLKRQIPLLVQDTRGLSESEIIPLLGQSFFGDLPYMVDDSRGMIVFSKPLPESFRVAGPGGKPKVKLADNEVPFRRSGNNIVITVKVNGRECEMYFDTGADSVAFADRHLAQCGLNRPTDAYAGHGGGVGGRRDMFAFSVDSIKVGPVERKDVRACVLINANFDRPLLGQTFLSGLKYTIDPVRNVIRFD